MKNVFEPTEKQNEVFFNILNHKSPDNGLKHIAIYGGSRSGKTILICWHILLMRAMVAPNSYHAIIRDTTRSIKTSIFEATLIDKILKFYPFNEMWKGSPLFKKKYGDGIQINKKDLTVKLPNGAIIHCLGLSSDSSKERILGTEFSTIYLNECSSLKSSILFSEQTILSRLAAKPLIEPAYQDSLGETLDTMVFYDFNPPYKNHWTYSYFIEKKNPITGLPLSKNVADSILVEKINPIDNTKNISKNYIANVKEAGDLAYKRFILGEFLDLSGRLINTNNFVYYQNSDLSKRFDKVFITTDYAFTTTTHADYSVFCYWGSIKDELYLLDMVRFKALGEESNKRLENFYNKCCNRFGVEKILIENVTSNKMFIQINQQKFLNIILPLPRVKDKYSRLLPFLQAIENGKVFLPSDDVIIDGVQTKKDITQPFLLECESFSPDGSHDHDDIVDNLIDAFSHITPKYKWDFSADLISVDW
jgi:predicted phage terminase large subunit-like protein